jgi:toxin ParE1/3/4
VTRTIVVSPATAQDIADAVDWYEEQTTGLGARLADDLEALKKRIVANPLQFPPFRRGSRRALLRTFPYALIFRQHGDEIRLLACFHTRRDPRQLSSRVQES